MDEYKNIYENGTYFKNNPTWDIEDSFFKYIKIHELIIKNNLKFNNVCEIGCGRGEILRLLKKDYPKVNFFGYSTYKSQYINLICNQTFHMKL